MAVSYSRCFFFFLNQVKVGAIFVLLQAHRQEFLDKKCNIYLSDKMYFDRNINCKTINVFLSVLGGAADLHFGSNSRECFENYALLR